MDYENFYLCFADSNSIPKTISESPSTSTSGGKLTTWSNLGSKQRSESYTSSQQQQQPQSDRWSRSRCRNEENNNNNNVEQSENNEQSRKSKSLPDMGRDRRNQQNTDNQQR